MALPLPAERGVLFGCTSGALQLGSRRTSVSNSVPRVAASTDGSVLAVDETRGRVLLFDRELKLRRTIRHPVPAEIRGFRFALSATGRLVATTGGNGDRDRLA